MHNTVERHAYHPARWYWRIEGDDRYWSSAAAGWTDTVPEGVPVTSIATIEGLDEVLRRSGLASPVVTVDDFRVAIQAHLDATARGRRYDSANSLASYAASTNPAWAAEAQAFIEWRDGVWAYAYAELDKVMAGKRGRPRVAEFIGELSVIEWPEAA